MSRTVRSYTEHTLFVLVIKPYFLVSSVFLVFGLHLELYFLLWRGKTVDKMKKKQETSPYFFKRKG